MLLVYIRHFWGVWNLEPLQYFYAYSICIIYQMNYTDLGFMRLEMRNRVKFSENIKKRTNWPFELAQELLWRNCWDGIACHFYWWTPTWIVCVSDVCMCSKIIIKWIKKIVRMNLSRILLSSDKCDKRYRQLFLAKW